MPRKPNGKRPGRPRSRRPLNPAARIIRRFGGERTIANLVGASPSAPYRWQLSLRNRGTGGLIPPRYHFALIDAARSLKIKLAADDFYKRKR